MILENQTALVKWHPKNKNYYVNKGYIFTFMGDSFEVKIEDLPLQSHAEVLVQCDFCGKILKVKYQNYNNRGKLSEGYACVNCKSKKTKNSVMNKYHKENVFAIKEVKEKIKKTNLKKYGKEHYSSTKECKERIKNTCLKRYGVESYPQSKEYKKKTIETSLSKRGYEYHTQDPEVINKILHSFKDNGTGKTSKPQNELNDLLKEIYGESKLNYPCGRCSLDCFIEVNGIKIDVEYDGEYWHKNTKDRDRKRNYFVLSQGYKILRIKGNREIPSKRQIIEAVNKLLNGKNIITIITDIK